MIIRRTTTATAAHRYSNLFATGAFVEGWAIVGVGGTGMLPGAVVGVVGDIPIVIRLAISRFESLLALLEGAGGVVLGGDVARGGVLVGGGDAGLLGVPGVVDPPSTVSTIVRLRGEVTLPTLANHPRSRCSFGALRDVEYDLA
jgi:hypothetical protein